MKEHESVNIHPIGCEYCENHEENIIYCQMNCSPFLAPFNFLAYAIMLTDVVLFNFLCNTHCSRWSVSSNSHLRKYNF